jgi:hypothetical protein
MKILSTSQKLMSLSVPRAKDLNVSAKAARCSTGKGTIERIRQQMAKKVAEVTKIRLRSIRVSNSPSKK